MSFHLPTLSGATNRNTTVEYSNTPSISPDITRAYDGAVNGKGRFWYSYAGGDYNVGQNVEHTAIDHYDLAGKPVVKRQLFKFNGTWGPGYQMIRYYNVSGRVTWQVYPASHTTGPTYDNAGRQNGISGTLGDGTNRTYVSNITYTSSGQMQEERFGTTTSLYHKLRYNSRGQLYDIRLSTVSWTTNPLDWNRGCLAFYHDSGYHWGGSPGIDTAPDNNGNVLRSQYWRPGDDQFSTYSVTQDDYTYDELNRLKSVTEFYQTGQGYTQQFVQAYSYDRWGNRTINTDLTSPVVNNLRFEVEQTTNRLLALGDIPLAPVNRKIRYDEVGNITNDSWSGFGDNTPGVITRTYDAENHMTSARDNLGGWAYYIYDADGQRTRTKVNNQETWFVYGFEGELVAEYPANTPAGSPQKEYAYRDGQLLVTANGSDLRWLVSDHLGTPRMIADLTGSLAGIRRHDYLPFGEELGSSIGSRTVADGYASGDGVRQKFTEKERDNETGLDYFGERYYANTMGRFTTTDPLMASAKTSNPQSWNRYVYVLNNPLRYVDPDGLDNVDPWNQLTIEEKRIIEDKLIHLKTTTDDGKPRLETDREAFNRLIGSGTEEEMANKVAGVKNLIDNLGGHENSEAWRDIFSISSIWLGKNNSVGIELHTEGYSGGGGDRFRMILERSGQFDVNRYYEAANVMNDHVNSARFVTDKSTIPSMHLIQERGYAGYRWDVHWDPNSSAFRNTNTVLRIISPIFGGHVERAGAAATHENPKSAVQVRQELKRAGIVPGREP